MKIFKSFSHWFYFLSPTGDFFILEPGEARTISSWQRVQLAFDNKATVNYDELPSWATNLVDAILVQEVLGV